MAKGIAHREWVISREEFHDESGIDEGAFRAAIENEQALNVHLMERMGVAVISAPIRRRWPGGGGWYTEAYVFKTATVPAAREEVADEIEGLEDALAEVAPEPEPVEAE